jgi:hypothetical protein
VKDKYGKKIIENNGFDVINRNKFKLNIIKNITILNKIFLLINKM